MNRLDELLARPRPALITYLCAGDPSPACSAALFGALVEGGADIVEVGVPFSDPGADGPAIQRASERALAAGAGLEHALDVAAGLPDPVGRVLFGYLNPFLRYGYERLAARCEAAGVHGVLCVDCPPEEEPELGEALGRRGVHLIRLVAPTTPDDRVVAIAHGAGGFLYYVSMTGVTGAAFAGGEALRARVRRVRALAGLPVAVGFGIATPAQAREVGRDADAVVVGSALVRLVAEHGAEAAPHLRQLTRDLKRALDA